MVTNLGKLEKVNLRDAWNHEATDFTNWLAKEENLSRLSEEIGIDIRLIQTEASVGNFNVDILAEEESTSKKIIIENQLETTDHDHLGKLITYASGHDAKIVLWIVKDVREEHRQAIDWLNENTTEDLNFFAIKMELWKIGESLPAPKFQIISKPNDWAKAVKKSSNEGKLTDTKLLQLEFWEEFKRYTEENRSSLRMRKPYPQHWADVSIGFFGVHLSFTLNTQNNILGCALYIPDNKQMYKELEKSRNEIDSEINANLKWMELPNKKASRIILEDMGDLSLKESWPNYFEWFQKWGEKFQSVFREHIKKINSESRMKENFEEENE